MISLLSITNPDLARFYLKSNGIVRSTVSSYPLKHSPRWIVWEDKETGKGSWMVAVFTVRRDAVKMSKAINEKIALLTH